MTTTEILAGINAGQRFPPTFYCQKTEQVAQMLLGAIFVHHKNGVKLAARIVETEAYLAENDEASHSYSGKTDRNATMFAEGGILYVYKIYGLHHCINVVTETKDRGCAVLLRAMEPLSGLEQMESARGKKPLYELCKGPGNLAKAFGFTIAHDRHPLDSETIYIVPLPLNKTECIISTPRIGISKATDKLLRFLINVSPCVSRP